MKLRIAVSALLPGTSALTPRLRRLQSESGNSFPSCNICGEGAISNNPDAVLQISGLEGKTCAELATDGQDGHISEVICNLLPLAIADVCGCLPVSDSQPPPSPTPSPDSCSCSPRDVTFQLQLNRNCSTDTISGAPGIAAAACNIRSGADEFDVSTLEISDIQFLEFGADLEVLNQNDTFANTSLTNGETFSYPSISNMLNPDMAIEEQLQYFPIGASLILQGKAKDSSGNDVIVRNQVAWTYTKSCADLPISVGQSIGWVDIADEKAPSPDFCVPPSTNESTAPAAFTSLSYSMSQTIFGGSKGGKVKTPKDPMAKVAKSAEDAKAQKVSKSSKSKAAKTGGSAKSAKMFKTSMSA